MKSVIDIFIRIALFIFAVSSELGALEQPKNFPTILVPNAFNTIHPVQLRKAQDIFVSGLIYETLFQVNGQGEVIPALSKRWEFNKTSKEIIITLHSGHFFSDGSEVTAKAVANSFKLLCQYRPLHLSSLFRSIKDCNKKQEFSTNVKILKSDKLSITILSTPSAFLHQLAALGASVFKVNNGTLHGSGPYQAKMLENRDLELIPNPFYHDKASIKNNGLHLVYKPGQNTYRNLTELKPAGSVMLLSNMGGQFDIPNYEKISHIPYITQTLVLNPQHFPFNHIELRRAIQADLYNHGRLHECGPSAEQSFGFIANGIGGSFVDLPQKLILDEPSEGFTRLLKDLKKKPSHLTIHEHMGRKNECEEQRIKKTFQKYNILADFNYHRDYKTFGTIRRDNNTQAYIELFVFLLRDAAKMLNRFSSFTDQKNLFYWANNEIQQIMTVALSKESIIGRFPHYRKINRIIHHNANVIDLYYVGHTNYIHRCYQLAQPEFTFNPNSFNQLATLEYIKNCSTR